MTYIPAEHRGLTELLAQIEASVLATFLRGSFFVYPLVNSAHILAIGVLVTCAALMDLRILGLGQALPEKVVLDHLRPATVMALRVAVVTGGLLFSVRPLDYVNNPAFRVKLALVGAAIVNAALYMLLAGRLAPALRKALATLSLLFWLLALVSGRFIGFLA
jgi:hypothetical protein